MRPKQRVLLIVAIAVALLGTGLLTARFFPGAGAPDPGSTEIAPAADSVSAAEWRRAHPWMFGDEPVASFREKLLLPFAKTHDLGPRNLRRHGEIIEFIVPRGRPVHEYALSAERRAARARLELVEGREIGGNADRVEYRFADAGGNILILRVSLGRAILPGAAGLALVITDLWRAGDADLDAWLDFPEPVTLVFPDTHAVLGTGRTRAAGREIFLELPMEPTGYPAIRPGPRAVFIDHSREDVDRVLRARLERYPAATGFATRHGGRAIEHPHLMESTLSLLAERDLIFLDLTGSPRSLTASTALRTGAVSHVAVAQSAPGGEMLGRELETRAARAGRFGEGVWVLRHSPGLPADLASAIQGRSELLEQSGVRWVTLRELRPPSRN
jgi:hypothetical protein